MHTSSDPPPAADRASRDASLTLGLTLPTDTVLYLLLPLHAAAFGVSFAEAGLLLAANRLVRIIGYGWVARSYERQRAAPCLRGGGAGVGASPRSAMRCCRGSGGCWLARLVWGLSFAVMNIATQALATALPEGAARRSGRSRAIIACGPMVGLIGGALIAEAWGPHVVFLLLAGVALLGLPFALRLPAGQGDPVRGAPRFGLPARIDVWSFVQGMALDGVFVLGLAVLASAALGGAVGGVAVQGAALAAGAALALRYASEIALGPAGGMLAERYGRAADAGAAVLRLGGGAGADRRGRRRRSGWARWRWCCCAGCCSRCRRRWWRRCIRGRGGCRRWRGWRPGGTSAPGRAAGGRGAAAAGPGRAGLWGDGGGAAGRRPRARRG